MTLNWGQQVKSVFPVNRCEFTIEMLENHPLWDVQIGQLLRLKLQGMGFYMMEAVKIEKILFGKKLTFMEVEKLHAQEPNH